MTDRFCSKIVRLDELNDEETKREILTEMCIKLRSMRIQELEEITCNLDLAGLFSQLTSNDRQCIEEICNILRILMDSLEPGEAHRRYPAELCRFIVHSESAPKILVLKELKRQVANPEKLQQLLQDISLVTLTVERIADEDLSVANIAMDVMKKIGTCEQGIKALYSGTLLRTIARLLVKNDIASFRLYEVVVGIAIESKVGLEASSNSGFLNSLINILDNDDILLQLNALEILSVLASNEDGLNYLEQRDVLRRLAEKIARANEDTLSSLIVPGLMKFFGRVALSRPNEIFSKYPGVVSALFEVIQSEDTTLLGNALNTLGVVASSVEGKYALQLLGDSMPCALKRISEIIRKMPSALRLRGLENLALIMSVEKNEQDNRILSLTKSWFDCLGDDPLGIIVSLCKQPFPDIRESSLEVMATIALQTWGQEYIANCPGLIEFLLDRDTEAFKNCKDLKYRIVKILTEADIESFDPETFETLQKFIRQGPHHVDAEPEIMTEGAC